MSNINISFESIREFCTRREVDIMLTASTGTSELCFRGSFDGHGDFFSILATTVEYVDIAGGFTVGDMLMPGQLAEAIQLTAKWQSLSGLYSGPSIVVRSAASDGWTTARPQDLFLVVANHFEFIAGVDWVAAGGR
jgi:hypothetical protein